MPPRLFPAQNPLIRLLSALALLAVFVISFFVGVVVFLAVLGVMLLLGLTLYLRFWRLRRSGARQRQAREQARGATLEGEYTRHPDRDS